MIRRLSSAGAHLRVLSGRALVRLGLREESFLLVLAVLVGVITATAAVAFHELIVLIRTLLYERTNAHVPLYGAGIVLLIALPALGGLVVGLVSTYVVRAREGHGVVDVMESVARSSGFIRPGVAVEKILTSAVTIGSGGSAGAEGPIVQIGAAIAAGVGSLFRVARPHMPLLIGCGSAAGISAIFNAPIGGVLFTLEVILRDFSLRTFTPVVLASVIANVTTQAIFRVIHDAPEYKAIFALPPEIVGRHVTRDWGQVGTFILLGTVCGLVGVTLTKLMYRSEALFGGMRLPRALRPALGGALLGVMGVAYVMIFGWLMLKTDKPFTFQHYPMPAFFGDGYGVIQQLLTPAFYAQPHTGAFLLLLAFLVGAKIVATCLTLSSGGSGGIIAPSLFLGAVTGAGLGLNLAWLRPGAPGVMPEVYALVGMGAVLAAVVHAPLASILIVFELTKDDKIILPAMLACIFATASARLVLPDSIYTLGLRRRGVRLGAAVDETLLRRLTVEQVDLEPATVVAMSDHFQRVLDLVSLTSASAFAVVDDKGTYAGMVVADDIQTALLAREAIPLLLVRDAMRPGVPLVRTSDDLAAALDAFARYDVDHLPVSVASAPTKVIGLISRAALMRRYQRGLTEA